MTCSRRNPKHIAKNVYHLGHRHRILHGHFVRKGRGENQKFIKYTMDLLIPDYVIKKGRPHGHRYGEKPGGREYVFANQLNSKCKKKFFQDIHDRFIRDEQFRNRTTKNDRDEDACRLNKNITITKIIGALVRTRQVPKLCQCSADLTSNKHRLPCSTWNRMNKELYKRPQTLTKFNTGHNVLLHCGLLIPMTDTMEMNQVLTEHGDLFYKYLEQFFRAWFPWIHLLFCRWIVNSWRRSTDGGPL